jgi:hypothetical protein
MGIFAVGDEDRDWPLLRLCDVLCSTVLEPVHELVADREDEVGWEIALDPEEAPAYTLPWLAQFAGVTLEPSLSEAEQRAKIQERPHFARGRPASLLAAIKATLTGTKTVLVTERDGGEAYQLRVRTYASETPSEDATLAAILTQKPGGIVLTYEAITGQSYSDFAASVTDYADAAATYDDYADVRSTLP